MSTCIPRSNSTKQKKELFSKKSAEMCELTEKNSLCHCPCDVVQHEPAQNDDGDPWICTSVPMTLHLSRLVDGSTKVYHIASLKDKPKKGTSPLFLKIPLVDPDDGSLEYDIIETKKHQICISHDGKIKKVILVLKDSKLSVAFTKKVVDVVKKLVKEEVISKFTMNGQSVLKNSVQEKLDAPAPCVRQTMSESMSSVPQGPFSRKPLSFTHIQELCKTLSAAINMGSVSQSSQIASRLAAEKVKINFDVDEESVAKPQSFPLTVHVEDRESGTSVKLNVFASDTIRQLKHKLLVKFKFPVEVQKWIIRKKIPNDNETLYTNDIREGGYKVYVYLMKAKSVSLSSPNARTLGHSMSNESNSSEYVKMTNRGLPPQGLHGAETLPRDTRVRSGGSFTLPDGAQTLQSELSRPMTVSDTMASSPPGPTIHPPFIDTENQPSGLYAYMQPPKSIGSAKKKTKAESKHPGWECPRCTYINPPTRPGCEVCACDRPEDYKIPEGYILSAEEQHRILLEKEVEERTKEAQEEEVRSAHNRLVELLETDNIDLIKNFEEFDCPICFEHIEQGDGVVLRDCLHMFCRECLMGAAQYAEEAELKCPYQDENYACQSVMQEREIRNLVDDQIFQQILQRSLTTAESQASNSYHCATTDCHGWCLYEDLVNFFTCPVCKKENCLTCKAIHEGQNCKQYQENLKIQAANNITMKETKEYLEAMVKEGNAMNCPQCGIIIMKKDGCDWIKCSCCKTEICWVTKGRRWGPMGEGDTSGGCRCGVNNARCHVNCNNCH